MRASPRWDSNREPGNIFCFLSSTVDFIEERIEAVHSVFVSSHGIYHPQRWRVEWGAYRNGISISARILEGIGDGETKGLLGAGARASRGFGETLVSWLQGNYRSNHGKCAFAGLFERKKKVSVDWNRTPV